MSCCSLALIAICTSLGRIDPQANQLQGPALATGKDLLCWGWTHGAGLASVGLWCLPGLPLDCVSCGEGWVVILHGLKLFTGCTSSGASQELQGQSPPTPRLRPLGMSYSVICRCLLHVLDLEVIGRGQARNNPGCHECQAWGHLTRGMGYTETKCCLFERF